MGLAARLRPANRPLCFWALWASVLLVSACQPSAPPEAAPTLPPVTAQVVSFKSIDGIGLKADWIAPKEGPVFLIMHGLGAGRGEWQKFSAAASGLGAGVFAFDARGHGESEGGNYRDFKTVGAWAAIINDFEASFNWLKEKGVSEDRIVLGGASLGANLAVHVGLKHPKVRKLLLLSPGQVYAGIPLQPALHHLTRPIVIAAAKADRYSYDSVGSAVVMAKEPKPAFLETLKGHGVGMFDGDEEFLKEVLREALR